MMKYLRQYEGFNLSAFLTGKVLKCAGSGPWSDFATKELRGTKLTLVIAEDHTVYRQKPGENYTNQFEKFIVKVPKTDLVVAPGAVVELVDAVATVYGDYRNQLSVTAADIKIVQPNKA